MNEQNKNKIKYLSFPTICDTLNIRWIFISI